MTGPEVGSASRGRTAARAVGWLGAAIVLALAVSEAGAADVRGTLTLPPLTSSTPGASLYDKYGETHQAEHAAPASAELRGVVYLRPREGTVVPARTAPLTPIMDQSGVRFVPRVVPVQAGGSVRFTNSDPVFHNVFSLSPARAFDLGRHPKGDSRTVDFPTPGVVQVYCDIHAEMSGFVVVVDSPYFSVVEPDGSYRIRAVPAGSYDAVVWTEEMTGFRTLGRVEVPDQGEVLLPDALRKHGGHTGP